MSQRNRMNRARSSDSPQAITTAPAMTAKAHSAGKSGAMSRKDAYARHPVSAASTKRISFNTALRTGPCSIQFSSFSESFLFLDSILRILPPDKPSNASKTQVNHKSSIKAAPSSSIVVFISVNVSPSARRQNLQGAV